MAYANMSDLTTVTANNSPAGTDNASTADDILRAHAAIIRDAMGTVYSAGGTANAITVTVAPTISAYFSGHEIAIKTGASSNTGAVTINVNSLGTKAIVKGGTTALVSGELAADTVYRLKYDGTSYQIVGGSSSDWINVKQSGATGDGTTDDSTEVGAAATAAAGGTLFFPYGTYLISNVSLPANIKLTGPGTIKLKAAAAGNLNPAFRLTGANVTFSGLTFDGNRANHNADGFSDSWNTGAGGTGKSNRAMIYGDNSGTGYAIENVAVLNCSFTGGWGACVALRDVSNVIALGNVFADSNFEGVFCYTASGRNTGVRVSQNIFDTIASGDATVNANCISLSSYDGVVVSGNEGYSFERNLVKLENCNRASVTGNIIDTNTIAGFSAIQAQANGTSISISNNVLRNVQQGIVFNSGTYADVTVSGNTITGVVATGASADAIQIASATNVTIDHNVISAVNRHGILSVNCSNLTVCGNNVSPNAASATAGVGIYASYTANGTDCIISGNYVGAGFGQAVAAGSGAVAVEASGFTVTGCSVNGNIVHTDTDAATERGIRLEVGTFVKTQVINNYTTGVIACTADAITFNNLAGRVNPTNAMGNIIGFGSAAPSTGDHFAGEIQLHNAPAAGGNIGWVCTTGGSPGTWKTFGAIAA